MTTLPAISMPNDGYRRVAGFGLGALVGATFGVVSQYGNRLVIPGAPLYQPPLGMVGNIILLALGVGVLGLLVAWPRSGLAGTAIAAALSAVAIIVFSYASAGARRAANPAATMLAGLFLMLPFWGMLVPVLGALRWAVSHDEEARRDRQPWYRRLPQPLVLLLVVGAVSLTALYRDDARTLISKTHQLLQAAQSGGATSKSLADTDFAARGQGAYELSWERDRIERYRIPRPGKNFDQHSVVVARFKNGWNLVCLYVTLTDPPLCRGMEELPR